MELRVHFPHGNLECKTCGKIFLNKEFLILHIRSDHVNGNTQKIEPEKTEHKNTEPQEIEPQVKRIKKSLKLRVPEVHHKKVEIMKELTHLCPIEPKNIEHQNIEPQVKRIKTSLNSSVSDANLNCNFCGKTLLMHVRSVHEICKICRMSFSNKGTLSLHVRSVHEGNERIIKLVRLKLIRLNLKKLDIKILNLKR